MNSSISRLLAMALLGSLAAGCATATSDPETTTRIESDPSGATCTLENSKGYRNQVVTPSSVRLHRDLAPLSIACSAPGHASIREEFKMDGNAMVLGNILVGGLIGVAVDAASGASERFPERISVLLDPSEFDTIADRDRWYEKKKAQIEKQALAQEMELDNTNRGCQYNSKSCTDIKDRMELEKRAELAKLDQVRATALVRQTSTVIEVNGQKKCLVQTGGNTWESRPCAGMAPTKPAPARVEQGRQVETRVEGQQDCLVLVKPNTWESRPCTR